MTRSFESVAIVGLGRVGAALAVLLWRQGYRRLRVCDPNPEKVKDLEWWLDGPVTVCPTPLETVVGAELVFLAVQDRYIAEVADNLAKVVPGADVTGLFFAHLSGSLTSAVLQPLAALGGITFSLHPLQSVADVEGGVQVLPGSYFSFEGDERARSVHQSEKPVQDFQNCRESEEAASAWQYQHLPRSRSSWLSPSPLKQ